MLTVTFANTQRAEVRGPYREVKFARENPHGAMSVLVVYGDGQRVAMQNPIGQYLWYTLPHGSSEGWSDILVKEE